MSLKIERVMLAMVEHEGWKSIGYPNFELGSVSYRHHNPGNLRASPYADRISDGYAVFGNDTMGWFALRWDIEQKSKGNTSTGLGPNSTLREFIFKWAPKTDNNDPEAYLQTVLEQTGLLESTTLAELFQ